MTTKLNRRDIGYTIISRFEEAFRKFLSEALTILFSNYQEGIPSGVIDKAKERSIKEAWDNCDDFFEDIDFPDLKEIACFKGMYKDYFPKAEFSSQQFQDYFDELYKLRCKIAHIRGIFTSLDLDKLSEISKKLASFIERFGEDFIEFIKVLDEHPEEVVIPAPIEFSSSNIDFNPIPNNLPVPDYEFEGGFVGRGDDIKKVIRMLEGEQVVTIAGAGGVGKTALASKVVEEVLNSKKSTPDAIVWLSAKETKLSYLGIEDIEPTVKNYEQLLDTILEVVGFPSHESNSIEQKEIDVKIISQLFQSILLVVDNLETITDESIVNFILDIRITYPTIKVLITSRRGLGQVERRYELKQLKEKEAVVLFRLIAKDKGLIDLVKLEEETIKILVKKVSYYPLAIKWMLGQVAIGKSIYQIIDSIDETTSDISRFSFEQIYNGISDSARKILCTLSCFDEPPPAGVLRYVVEIDKEELEDGIKELILVSLVIPERFKNEQGELSTRYILLPLTRGYVRHQLDKDSIFKRNIEERLRIVQVTIEEAERASKQYRFNLSNMGAVTEEEKVAAMIAQNAFQKYQSGRYVEAHEEYRRACEIAPRFASVYRNWAVMESQEGHLIEADKLMEKASRLSPNDPQIWLTWGNIKRKTDRIKEALEKYEKAYELDNEDPIIMNALGQAKCRCGDYVRADQLFRSALQKIDALQNDPSISSVKNKIINRASLADNLARWGEALSKDKNYKDAEVALKEALKHCEIVIELDRDDIKSLDLQRDIYRKLGFFYKKIQKYKSAILAFQKAIVNKPRRYREAKDTITVAIQIGEILYSQGNAAEAKYYCSSEFKKIAERLEHDTELQKKLENFCQKLSESKWLRGTIEKIENSRGFVIIATDNLLKDIDTYFGHINSFVIKIDELTDALRGRTVSFLREDVKTNGKIRKEAKSITFLN